MVGVDGGVDRLLLDQVPGEHDPGQLPDVRVVLDEYRAPRVAVRGLTLMGGGQPRVELRGEGLGAGGADEQQGLDLVGPPADDLGAGQPQVAIVLNRGREYADRVPRPEAEPDHDDVGGDDRVRADAQRRQIGPGCDLEDLKVGVVQDVVCDCDLGSRDEGVNDPVENHVAHGHVPGRDHPAVAEVDAG